MKTTMKNLQNNIQNNKDIQKQISKKLNHYSSEQMAEDIKQYIKAIKEERMICVIPSVSASGMSRIIKYMSCEKRKSGFYYRNYYSLFIALGYSQNKNMDGFRINGCGMDMNFHTNYSNIHSFKLLGAINDEQCRRLAQMTPTVI